MTQITMTVTGIEEVKAKLDKIAYATWLRGLLTAAAADIEGRAKKIPTWSSPRYLRGWGPILPSGKRGPKTSEMLSRQWHVSSAQFSATVANIGVSYSEYVIGEHQTSFHGEHGWPKLSDEAKKEVPKLLEAIAAKIKSLWNAP